MRNCLFSFGLSVALLMPAAAQTIHVVTEQTPYTYMVDGKVAGSATEVVELSLQRAGLKDYRVNLYPWAHAYDLALKTPNVLIYLIARTAARENQFRWAGEIMKIQYHLYRLKQRPLAITDLESAKRFTIGVMRDDVRQQYLITKGFDRLVVSAQSVDNFRKLRGWGWKGFSRMNLWRQDKGQAACARAFVEALRVGGAAPIPLDELLEVSRVSIELQQLALAGRRND